MSKRMWALVALLVLVGGILAACGGQTVVEVTRVVTETEVVEGEPEVVEVEVTSAPVEVEVEVTRVVEVEVDTVSEEEAARTGGWLDTIVFIQEPNSDAAVARLEAGDLDMYADDIAGEAAIQAINSENLQTRTQYGLYDELMFNTGTCADTAVLNPFQSQRIREAMNWAVDRDYIASELYNGLAVPKYTPVSEAGADRARFAAEIAAIEAAYAYDLERANAVVTEEMEAMGATLENDVWTFNGEPVLLKILIRNEDTRLLIGNYFANQLEDMGFTTERIERTSAELSPIWNGGDPLLCEWNVYTGAWSQTLIARSDTDQFDFFYNPRGIPWPAWAILTPSEEFDALSLRLFNNDYTSMEERAEMFAEALPMALEFSSRIWTTSRTTVVPFTNEVSVTTDLAAGVSGAALWSKTARFVDEVGGSMTIGLPSVFTEPWNPVAGSNWVFDNMVKRGIDDSAFYFDPNTGLAVPGRAERAEVVVQEGFPMTSSSDWMTLTVEPEIVVPDDAWAGWDAENQVFLTAADVYTETQTAVFKSTVYYPEDMFDTITWHDGSPISPADFVMNMILLFDLANEASPYYDETLVPSLQQFQGAFKAFRVASVDPLVIEHWGDNAQLDAELTPFTWWPNGSVSLPFGSGAWHNLAVALRGEGNGSIAFSVGKASANEIEQTNFIAGPTLEIMAGELISATDEAFIPYAPTLGQYVTAEEATTRYTNLAEFARRYGHYYLGTGVYFRSGVFPVEHQAVLTQYAAHPDPANRFANFAAPALPEVEVDGPARVVIGEEAAYDVFVEFNGEPYAVADMAGVTYLLFDATGAMVGQGDATAVEDGLWQVVLSPEVTGALAEGSNRLEIVAASNLVALPTIAGYDFVTAP